MKKIFFTSILIVHLNIISYSQKTFPVISVSKDIEVTKLSDHAYIHTSYSEIPPFGRIPSNGLIFVDKEKAFLFDTPVNDSLTEDLINWIEKKLKAEKLSV